MALQDKSTHMFNRRHFNEQIREMIARAGDGAGRLGLMLIDVDNFRMVNDTLGHQAGNDIFHNLAGGCAVPYYPEKTCLLSWWRRVRGAADAFDAITSVRQYRKGQSTTYGLEEILIHREDQFGQQVVDHFQRIFDRIPAAVRIIASAGEAGAFAGHGELMHSRRLL